MWAPHKQMTTQVHTNSGVLNHWFYILTIGSQEQMTLETYNVTGINIDKAAKSLSLRECLFVC
jgi:Zn-dependent metalloprotease